MEVFGLVCIFPHAENRARRNTDQRRLGAIQRVQRDAVRAVRGADHVRAFLGHNIADIRVLAQRFEKGFVCDDIEFNLIVA